MFYYNQILFKSRQRHKRRSCSGWQMQSYYVILSKNTKYSLSKNLKNQAYYVILSRKHSERVETSRKSNYNHDLNIAFNMIPKIKLTVARNIERRTSIPSVFFWFFTSVRYVCPHFFSVTQYIYPFLPSLTTKSM